MKIIFKRKIKTNKFSAEDFLKQWHHICKRNRHICEGCRLNVVCRDSCSEFKQNFRIDGWSDIDIKRAISLAMIDDAHTRAKYIEGALREKCKNEKRKAQLF